MPITRRFSLLLERISQSQVEIANLDRHRDTVCQRLEPMFTTPRFLPIGSYTRGSAVTGSSDIDLLLCLRREDVQSGNSIVYSDSVLDSVRTKLQTKFASSNIGKDGQAVAIRFSRGESRI